MISVGNVALELLLCHGMSNTVVRHMGKIRSFLCILDTLS